MNNKQERQPLKHDVHLLYNGTWHKGLVTWAPFHQGEQEEEKQSYTHTHTHLLSLDMAWHMQEVSSTLWPFYPHVKNSTRCFSNCPMYAHDLPWEI